MRDGLGPLGVDLQTVLFGPEAESRLHAPGVAAPVLVAVEYALAQLWRAWGIEPAAVVGGDVGKLAAAVVAGVATLEDALRLAVTGGHLATELPSSLPAADARRLTIGLAAGREERRQVIETLATVWAAGVEVDWAAYDAAYPRRRLALPTYPFQRQRYWFEDIVAPPARARIPEQEWLYEVAWRPQPLPSVPPRERRAGSWLIVPDEGGVGAALARQLTIRGQHCVLVPAHVDVQADSERMAWRGVVHLRSLDATPVDATTTATLNIDQRRGCGSLLTVVQAFVSRPSQQGMTQQPPRVWVVTQGAQPVTLAPALAVAQAPVWGLGRVIALEHGEVWGGLVDLDPGGEVENAAAALAEEVLAEAKSNREDQVGFRDGRRYVARLVRRALPESPPAAMPIRADGTYVIAGGWGGLGLAVAQWLVAQGARHLVLMGRRAPGEEAQQAVRALEDAGARVLGVLGDIGRAEDVARLVAARAAEGLPPVRGVVHAAGTLADGVLAGLTWDRFAEVLAAKVAGSWELHRQLRDEPLDWFVLFSSSAAVLGSPGQGNYAAANAFLDALAHYRRAQGLPAVSINWGPWSEAGMAARQSGARRWAGVGAIAPLEGLRVLGHVLSTQPPQVAVLPIDWASFVRGAAAAMPPLLTDVTADALASISSPAERWAPFRQELALASSGEQQRLLEGYLLEQATALMRLDAPGVPDQTSSLMELGFDSLLAVDLKSRVAAHLGVAVPVGEILLGSSITRLAALIVEQLKIDGPTTSSSSDRFSAEPEEWEEGQV